MQQEFIYIKQYYKVPAEINREVIVGGKKGVITKDMGNYIGVTFYDSKNKSPQPCHPTFEVEYLDTFNTKPPKVSRSARRYDEWLKLDSDLTFAQFLGIKKKKSHG